MSVATDDSRYQLRSYVERIERLRADKKDLGDDEKSVFAEAKANGFDTKAIRTVIRRRERDKGEVAEEEAILATYLHALGMADEETLPLFRAVGLAGGDRLSHERAMEAFKQLVPERGEIIVKVSGMASVRIWRDHDGVAHAEDQVDLPVSEPVASRAERKPEGDSAAKPPPVTPKRARIMGRTAGIEKSTKPNPFPKGDPNRAEWDAGYSEGMEQA